MIVLAIYLFLDILSLVTTILAKDLPATGVPLTKPQKKFKMTSAITNNLITMCSCICLGLLNWSISRIQVEIAEQTNIFKH